MQIKGKFIASAAAVGLLIAASGALVLKADNNGNPVEGRRAFLKYNCYSCHGGRAGGGMCPEFRSNPPDQDDVAEAVRNGTSSGMPAFPMITSQEIADIAAYFHSLRTANEPTFTHWWEPVPSQ